MKFSDIMTLLQNPDRVRIMQGETELYSHYFAMLVSEKEVVERFKDMEVVKFRCIPEIKHKRWKELKLMKPLKPEETPDFAFSDLQMWLYYTIWVEEVKV